jgi:hypothetical protein
MKPSPATVAAFVAGDFFKANPSLDAHALQDELVNRIETALRGAVREEREACAVLCDARRTLWTSTEEKGSTPQELRREARARSNEAAYLADAIRARGR